MSDYKCVRCVKEFVAYNSLRKHVGRIHKVHSTKFYVEFYLGGIWPTCKCGCREPVEWSIKKKSFCDYRRGHQSRIKNNWGHNPVAIAASSETRRKQYECGERAVWNDGLDESDPRVKNNIKHLIDFSRTDAQRKVRSERMKLCRSDGTIPTLFGKDSSHWKGGVSSVNQIARASNRLYKEWKLPILQRDGFKCTECSATKDLHVHHDAETFSEIIKKVMTIDDYENIENFDRKKQVAERVIDYHTSHSVSGKTLCVECHNILHPSLNFV